MDHFGMRELKLLLIFLFLSGFLACKDDEVLPQDRSNFRIDTLFMDMHWSTAIHELPAFQPIYFSEFIQIDEEQILIFHEFISFSYVYSINTTDGSVNWVQKFYISNVNQVELTDNRLLVLSSNSYILVNPDNGELIKELSFADIPNIEGFCVGNRYIDGKLILTCRHDGNATALTLDLQNEEILFLVETDHPKKRGYLKKIPVQNNWAHSIFQDQEDEWKLLSFNIITGDYRIVDVDPEYNHLFSQKVSYRNIEMDNYHLYLNYGDKSELIALDFETGKAVWDHPSELVRSIDGSLFGILFILKKLNPLSGTEKWSNNSGWSGTFPYGFYSTNNSKQLITFNGFLNITDLASGDLIRLFNTNQTSLDDGLVKGIFWNQNKSYYLKYGDNSDGNFTIMSLAAPWVE